MSAGPLPGDRRQVRQAGHEQGGDQVGQDVGEDRDHVGGAGVGLQGQPAEQRAGDHREVLQGVDPGPVRDPVLTPDIRDQRPADGREGTPPEGDQGDHHQESGHPVDGQQRGRRPRLREQSGDAHLAGPEAVRESADHRTGHQPGEPRRGQPDDHVPR